MNDLRLTGPNDLLSSIPYLLGFEPEHSLITLGLNGRHLECTFRVDLPPSLEHLADLNTLTGQLQANGCDAVILLAYGEAELAAACLERAAFDHALAERTVLDRLRVTDGRWYCHTPEHPGCSPHGSPIPDTSPASSQLAVAGAVRHTSRDQITALLDPVDDDRRAAVAQAVEDATLAEAELNWAEQRAADLYAIDTWTTAADLPGPDDIAALVLALGDLDVRDYALRVCAQRIDAGSQLTGLWLWVARHLDEDLLAPAATLAGWCAYRTGNGVLANEAFTRALQTNPDYRLAQMLMAALQGGIPPQRLPVPAPLEAPESTRV